MILIVDLTYKKDSLSSEEFVKPIEKIARQNSLSYKTKHYSELTKEDISSAKKIIICGTALKDNKFIDDKTDLSWIKETNKPILGICAGMQSLAKEYGCEIIPGKEIEVKNISTKTENKLFNKEKFEAYCLHLNQVVANDKVEILAESDKYIQAIKIKEEEKYGILFHAESCNEWIISNFLKLS